MRIFKPSLLKVQSLILLVFLIGMLSCEKSNNNNPEEPTSMMEEMSIPQDFDFKTTRDVTINISVLDNSGSPMVFIPIEVYKSKVNSSGLEIGDDVLVFKGFTDVQGNINSEISLATSIESLKIKTNYLGLINESIVPINGDQLAYSLGGLNNTKSTGQSNNINQGYYYTLGNWNGLGVPNYLVTPGDNITQDFLDDINASLPEALPLPVSHPMYFQSTTEYAIH
ncbi:MAG: hypothetical protein U9R19_04570, partial [Bacteroidota bacterium]|nr:hypothetical protein [Bacteroidota bacterium]